LFDKLNSFYLTNKPYLRKKISMTTFANQLKAEIARIAKKSGKAETAALKKSSSSYRSDIAELKRRIAALESSIARLAKHAGKVSRSGAGAGAGSSAETSQEKDNLRFRQDGFITLRKKLNLSANEMGQLLGVSGQSIYKWEQGKAKPRASQLPAIAAARKMGKKEVTAKLAGSTQSE
jgi:DNA-binding transcriptional regulator YiaG